MSEENKETRPMAIAPPSAIGADVSEIRKHKQYELEKKMGKRLPNGNWKLSRLTPRHLRMIGAHLNGDSNKEIAEYFGVHEVSVGRILRDPITEAYIADARENYDLEVKGLVGLAIEVVRTALRADDTDMALKGVSSLEKLNKMLNPDVVQVLQNPDDAAKTDDARDRFLSSIERLAEKFAPILEGEIKKGEVDGSADGEPADAEYVVEGEGRNTPAAPKDEYVAIPGPNAERGPEGSSS